MLNLAILALGIAVMGVSIGEGILVAFIEGTFFVLLACTFFVTTKG